MDNRLQILSDYEIEKRSLLESQIAEYFDAFVMVGNALAEIRDSHLYRNTHENFEDYMRDVWGKGREWARRTIQSSEVAHNLFFVGDNLPLIGANQMPNKETLLPLAKFEPDTQRVIMLAAANYSRQTGLELNSSIIKSTIEVFEDIAIDGIVDIGDGKDRAMWAAITQSLSERKSRQLDHIKNGSPWKRLEGVDLRGKATDIPNLLNVILAGYPEIDQVRVLVFVEKRKKER